MTKKSIKLAVGVIAIVVIVGGLVMLAKKASSSSSVLSDSRVSTTVSAETTKARATATIDKTFEFNAINQKKTEKKIKFTLVSVELKDEIKVKGEVRPAPKGYDYLLVRIEMENPEEERLALTPADLIRLEDNRGKLFAPDYHNGNVILDPLSVKKDLMSFMVNRDAKKFIFQIGELAGTKEKVEVTF